jgi:hypothetical protein
MSKAASAPLVAPTLSAPTPPKMPSAPLTPPSAHPASRVSLPQPIPPISANSSNLSNTHVPEAKTNDLVFSSIPKPAPVSPESTAKTGQVPVAQLRQVIEELRNIPLDLPAEKVRKPAPKAPEKPKETLAKPQTSAAPKQAFVPVEHFDECIRSIRAMHNSVHAVQAGNERAGAYEAQEKQVADALASSCDAIQTTLLAVDERLFQVN